MIAIINKTRLLNFDYGQIMSGKYIIDHIVVDWLLLNRMLIKDKQPGRRDIYEYSFMLSVYNENNKNGGYDNKLFNYTSSYENVESVVEHMARYLFY